MGGLKTYRLADARDRIGRGDLMPAPPENASDPANRHEVLLA
jgi:hypothetical protein